MDARFSAHNLHFNSVESFQLYDPQLSRLKKQYYVFHSDLIGSLPVDTPGIYTLGGGRQIGKTTMLKQWMLKLMQKDQIPAKCIGFLSGEIINDQNELLYLLQNQLAEMSVNENNSYFYLIIDEITYIKDWDKAIKYAADANYLENVILLLTGSDLMLMQDAMMRFPGRRGQADQVDFHLFPLNFQEILNLKNLQHLLLDLSYSNQLLEEFNNYLAHGGYLTAINDIAQHGKILIATLRTYAEWIRGDILKKGKQEVYLKEIINAIIKRYGTQITWNSLAKDLSIDSPKTVADYIELLVFMDAVYVQSALIEDKLVAAPKKPKKVIFKDPFIFHAMRNWLVNCADPYTDQIKTIIADNNSVSSLVESVVTATISRKYETFYIKSEGEVDVAYIKQNKFWPIEIKWTNQIKKSDLKQILKYQNGRIWTKTKTQNQIEHLPVSFLPLELANFD